MLSKIQKTTVYFGTKNEVVGYYNPLNCEYLKPDKMVHLIEMLVDEVNLLIDEINILKQKLEKNE